MAIYRYVGGVNGDEYLQGLPATDLDGQTLTGEQRVLLAIAIERGLYEVVFDTIPDNSKSVSDQEINEAIKGITNGKSKSKRETTQTDSESQADET